MNRKSRIFLLFTSRRVWMWLIVTGMAVACLLYHATTAHAYGLNQCAASRFGSDLGCTAGDVSITGIRVIGDTSSCIGGSSVTLDLELTVNFANPSRYDIGIFVSNDGGDPQFLGGAATCSVGILPKTSPFMDLDFDTCGDGENSLTGVMFMPGVTLACQSIAGGTGNLYIPYVVSWDNQTSTTCTTNADPVPSTKSKCNAPTIAQGSVSVVVLPTITNTDGVSFVHAGDSVAYSVVITNTTGVALSGAVFNDPAVANINVSSVTCAASGATCPAVSVAAMQGAGIAIPTMPVGGSVTFTITATMTGNPPDTLTNTASVTVNGQSASASDTDTVVGTIAIIPSNLSKFGTTTPPTLMVFNYTMYNFGASSDTIGLSALSNQGWTVQIRNAADTGTISSLTVPAGGSINFIVKAQVPAGAAIGTVDVTTITATSGNDPTKKATATAVTTVAAPLTFTPNNISAGGKGSFVNYVHRVQNNRAASTGVTFATVLTGACAGWTRAVYKADQVSQIPPALVTLPAFGGFEDIVVRVNIPATAAMGSTCTVTTTATGGGSSAVVVDATTVKDLILYSDPAYTPERYIFPAGNAVYAMAYGTSAGTRYYFVWRDPSGAIQRTSPTWISAAAPLPDTYTTPVGGPFGTWTVSVYTNAGVLFNASNFYVGPDHISASYAGANPVNTDSNVVIDLALHDRFNHVVPMAGGLLVKGSPPTTRDPLLITVTVSGTASIVSTTLAGAVIVGQTVTGWLNGTTGQGSITITDSTKETVTVNATTYNLALYGSGLMPTRDHGTTVTFVVRKMRILLWQEMVN